MYSTDDMSLKWKNFEENLIASFTESRKDQDFTDVTLVCEDGVQIEAHRLLLGASSPFFKTLLKMNSHLHPLIFMRGVKSSELTPLVEFLYKGEATVLPENLDNFLILAEELQLKGLTRETKTEPKCKLKREPEIDLTRKVLSKSNTSPLPLLNQKENDPKRKLPAISDVELLSESVEEKIRSMMTVSSLFFFFFFWGGGRQFIVNRIFGIF